MIVIVNEYNTDSSIHSFIHSFDKHLFIECLLYARDGALSGPMVGGTWRFGCLVF